MALQAWKKTPRFDCKGCAQEANDVLGSIVIESPTNCIKEILIKIKIDITYDTNSKMLLGHDVKDLDEIMK